MSSSRLRKLLLPLLRGYIAGKPRTYRTLDAARQAIFLLGKPSAKKVQGRLRREQQRTSARQSHNQETKAIRAEVCDRAGSACEGTGGHGAEKNCSGPLQLDHWLSGSGRRREKQSIENTWVLCLWHHRRRTANLPCAAEWNDRFGAHCAKYGYPFTPHIIHAEPAKAGGAP